MWSPTVRSQEDNIILDFDITKDVFVLWNNLPHFLLDFNFSFCSFLIICVSSQLGNSSYWKIIRWSEKIIINYVLVLIIFLNLFLIGGKLLCNVVLVYAIQHCKPVIILHIFPSSWIYLPSHNPPLKVITKCRAGLSVLYSNFPLAI